MITLASFLYVAALSCDESLTATADEGVDFSRFATTEHFHKVFLRDGDYFLEFDTNANFHYDSNGLGRLHKRGAPSPICISLPCTESPDYKIDGESSNISISVGVPDENGYIFSSEESVVNKFIGFADSGKPSARFEYSYPNGKVAYAEYEICDGFVEVRASSEGNVALMLPAFIFDGENNTDVKLSGEKLSVSYMGAECEYSSSAGIFETEKLGRNRNGYYKAYYTAGEKELAVKIKIN